MMLSDLCRQLNAIYASKNAREEVLTNIQGATLFIAGALKALNDDLVRRDFRNNVALLAILMKRMLLAIELWGVEQFVQELSRKYPIHGCVYCNHKPCACGKVKLRAAKLVGTDSSAYAWSLSDWQNHLDSVYGAVNRERYSVHDMVLQLNAEYFEAMIALQHQVMIRHSNKLDTQSRRAACEETTDFFSRLLGLGNHIGVSLEAVVLEHYKNGCPVCQKHICACRPFWEEYEQYEFAVAASTAIRK